MTVQVTTTPPGTSQNYESGSVIVVPPGGGLVFQIRDVDPDGNVGPVISPTLFQTELSGADLIVTLPDDTVITFRNILPILSDPDFSDGIADASGTPVINSPETAIDPAAGDDGGGDGGGPASPASASILAANAFFDDGVGNFFAPGAGPSGFLLPIGGPPFTGSPSDPNLTLLLDGDGDVTPATPTPAANLAPVFVPGGPFVINEQANVAAPNGTVTVAGSQNGDPVGVALALDPEGGPVTYAITGGDPTSIFAMNPATGAITVANAAQLDFEAGPAQFNLTISATDAAGATAVAPFVVNVNDINDGPALQPAGPFAVEERTAVPPPQSVTDPGAANGTVVGTVAATDEDLPANALTFAIVAGDPTGIFAIDNNGQITVADASQLDFEGGTTNFTLTVQTTDGQGGQDQRDYVVNVTDVNDAPALQAAGPFAIDENVNGLGSQNGDAVGTVNATDVDVPPDPLTFTIVGGTGQTAFAIDAASGEITVADAPQLDLETTPSFSLSVQVTDGQGGTDQRDVTVNLNNVNDPPAVDLNGANDAGENFDAGNFQAGAGATSIVDTDAQVVDVDSQIQSLNITFSAAPPNGANEVLAVNLGASGLVANPIANGIQLTGNADPSVYEGVLRTLTYDNTAGTPTDGARTINIQATDAGGATSNTANATITVVPRVFFIDNSVGGGPGDGSQNNPFRSIAEFNNANGQAGQANPQTGDTIFIRTGNGSYDEADGINLLNDQILLGQERADLLPSAITGEVVGTAPVINVTALDNHGIELGSGNTIRGLDIGNTRGTGSGIDDGGNNVGTLTISNVAIGGTGKAVDIDQGGTLGLTFESITSTSSSSEGIDIDGVGGSFTVTGATSIVSSGTGVDLTGSGTASFSFGGLSASTSGTGTGLNANTAGTLSITGPGSVIDTTGGTGTGVNITGTTIGNDGVTFRSISVNGATNGIVLNNTGNGSFTVTGDGSNTQNASGGTIQNTTDHGVTLNDTGGFSISSMNIANPGNSDANANDPNNVGVDGIHAEEIRGTNLIRASSFESYNSFNSSQAIQLENNGVSLDEFRVVGSSFNNNLTPALPGNLLAGSSAIRADLEAGTVNGNFIVNNNTFQNHAVAAVDFAVGDGTGGTGTIDIVIADNNFIGRDDVIVSNDIALGVQDGYTVNASVHNNSINKVKPVTSTAGVVSAVVGQLAPGAGPDVDLRLTENRIDEIRGRRGFNLIIEENVSDYDVTLFDNRVTNLVTEAAANCPGVNCNGLEALEMEIEDNAGAGEVRIVDNTFGTNAAGAGEGPVAGNGSREAIDISVQNGVSPDVLIHNNSLVTSDISSGEAIELDIEDTSTIDLTVTNNNLTGGNQNEGFTIETEDAGSTANVKFTGNTSTDEIEFDRDAGTLTITDRDSLATDNPGVAAVPGFSLVDNPGTTANDPTLPTGVVLATGGLAQIVTLNAAAGTDLEVTVLNANGTRAAGVTVTFAAPGAGASGSFTGGNTAVTDANGVATKAFSANATAGAYEITATAAGFEGASFLFQNEAVPAQFLTAATGLAHGLDGIDVLTQSELDGVVTAAKTRWAENGLSESQAAALDGLVFAVADLEGGALGAFVGDRIEIDVDAAGHGWFVDETPLDDGEFGPGGAETSLTATDGAAADAMDLLTTVLHEIGHGLGLIDLASQTEADDLMFALLDSGERRLPAAGQAGGPSAVALAADDLLDGQGTGASLGEAESGDGGAPSANVSPAYLAAIAAAQVEEAATDGIVIA
ncbi:MAG: cadherin domain-containing protein [Kiloniellales bacterium]|nr:cadherin domain-containing protein [Kiloniellales bacterium]